MPTWESVLQQQKSYEITDLVPNSEHIISIYGNIPQGTVVEAFLSGYNIGTFKNGELRFTPSQIHDYLEIRTFHDLTINKIQLEVGNMGTDWTKAPEELEQRVSTVEQTAEGTKTTLKDLKNDFESSMRYEIKTIDVDGVDEQHGVLELGEVNSPFKLWLWNQRISFIQNGKEVAYVSNNKLYITDGEFLTSLKIGNFAFTPRANGNLSFGKVV